DGSRLFVPVDERMVPGEPISEAGRQAREIRRRIGIRMQLLRPRQGGLEQCLIAHARVAAMLGDLSAMDGRGQRALDPDDHGYWASLWRRVRRRRITSSAASICAASSGL